MHDVFDQRRYLIPFRSSLLPQIFTDVLVIGSGVAGLSTALEAAGFADVVVLAKGELAASNTAWAQGGIAAVTDASDTIDDHVQNTLDAGAGLCDEPVVRRIISAGPEAIDHLVAMGMAFDSGPDGNPLLGREGGHNAHRVLHADGDATGAALSRTLIDNARAQPRVRLFDNCMALDLLTHDGHCIGALTHHPRFGLQIIRARAIVLASGGCGQLYRETTNPAVATGDGLAMAYRAGVELADLEFVQFHPTTLYVAGAGRFLITEAVRGEGAHLVNRRGERFMQSQHELADLAPRDIVSRAILRELAEGDDNTVRLDARHLGHDRFAARFPGITALLKQFDIDPGRDLIPIRPSAHYMIGGIWADEQGRSSLPGLLVCGEASTTGLHGANRLASNSLLEGLVCGREVGQACRQLIEAETRSPVRLDAQVPTSDRSQLDVADVRSTLRSVMWRHVGIERHGRHLAEVGEMFDFWARYTLDKIFDDRAGWEVQNLLWVGALVVRAAASRMESRGTHYRLDYTEPDDTQRGHLLWQRGSHKPREVAVREKSAGARP